MAQSRIRDHSAVRTAGDTSGVRVLQRRAAGQLPHPHGEPARARVPDAQAKGPEPAAPLALGRGGAGVER
jgi:hypothetical protein